MGSQPEVGINIDNDERMAYETCTSLESTHRKKNTQATQNIKHKLDTLRFLVGLTVMIVSLGL